MGAKLERNPVTLDVALVLGGECLWRTAFLAGFLYDTILSGLLYA
jgi:hypothetical protein